MEINNIKVEQVIKNYKELCLLIGEKTKTGTSKQAQLKEFERYFKYHKKGQKFIIDEIYNKPLPKKDDRSKYIEEIKDILTYYAYKEIQNTGNNVVTLSISEIINILGLANNTYSLGNSRRKELSDLLHIELVAMYNFYNTSRTEFKRIIDRALKNLKSRSVLIGQNTFMIANIDKNNKTLNKRPATDEECDLILDTQNGMLQYYNMKSFKDLFLAGSKVYKEFMEMVNKELQWDFYYPAYKLICGKNAVAREYKNILEKKKQLNDKSIDRLEKLFKITNKNCNEQKLINNLISFKGYDPNIDDGLVTLYKQNKHNYYMNLHEQDKKINEESYKKSKIKDEYKNRNIVGLAELMKYKNKMKKNNENEEYWNYLLNEVDRYNISN